MAFVIVHHLNSHYSSRLPKADQQTSGDAPHRANGTKIDGTVITLVDLEGKKDSYAGKTPRRPK
jgi:hypothetical protein